MGGYRVTGSWEIMFGPQGKWYVGLGCVVELWG